MISREEALSIAAAEIITRRLGTGAREALLAHERSGRLPLLYNGPNLADCWIVYAERPLVGLRSSSVVLVSRESGAVLYAGSASDEG